MPACLSHTADPTKLQRCGNDRRNAPSLLGSTVNFVGYSFFFSEVLVTMLLIFFKGRGRERKRNSFNLLTHIPKGCNWPILGWPKPGVTNPFAGLPGGCRELQAGAIHTALPGRGPDQEKSSLDSTWHSCRMQALQEVA